LARAKSVSIGRGSVVEGLDELLKQLTGLQNIDVSGAVEEAAKTVRDSIRAEAPVDTGSLRDSITQRVGKSNAIVLYDKSLEKRLPNGKTVASNKAVLVEFGSRNKAPNPFFSRGFRKAKGNAEAALTNGIKAALEKAL
jgi:HK97 gp10 family phage protein